MSRLRAADRAEAVIVADLHFSTVPPSARRAEPDWLEAQMRVLDAVTDICNENSCPLILCGDVFNTHKEGPSIIAQVIRHMPNIVYGIPGQHDCPYHNYEAREKSAYGVLVEAGVIIDLKPGEPILLPHRTDKTRIRVWGFPWGFPPYAIDAQGYFNLAVCHHLVWSSPDNSPMPDAPSENNIKNLCKNSLDGFHAAAFGDNHIQFDKIIGDGLQIYNCGRLIPRTQPEKGINSYVGMLYRAQDDDGLFISRKALDLEEKWSPAAPDTPTMLSMVHTAEFLESLSGDDVTVDFRDSVEEYFRHAKTRPEVKELILTWLESKR